MKIYRTIKLNKEELAKIKKYYLSIVNAEINEEPESKHIDVVIKKNGIKIEIYFKGTVLINSDD